MTEEQDTTAGDSDESLADTEPVEMIEVDEPPSGTPPAWDGWTDADPDDPGFAGDEVPAEEGADL